MHHFNEPTIVSHLSQKEPDKLFIIITKCLEKGFVEYNDELYFFHKNLFILNFNHKTLYK